MTNNNLDLAQLRALHAAANGHKLRVVLGTAKIYTDSSPSGYVGVCVFASDAAWLVAIHNAFLALAERLEAAERERDALQMRLNGRNATGGRDALLKRLGAAEAWDIVAERSRLVGDTAGEKYATEEAARLRREAGEELAL